MTGPREELDRLRIEIGARERVFIEIGAAHEPDEMAVRPVWMRLEDTYGAPGVIDGTWYRGEPGKASPGPQELIRRVLVARDAERAERSQ